MAALTGQEIIDKWEKLVEDEIDPTLALQLVNDAKDEIEGELQLYICEAVDSTKTTSVGQTYTTAKAVPDDFLNFSKPYIYVGQRKVYGVPLADKMAHKDNSSKYFYDPADGIHLCGIQGSSETIHIPYIKATDDIALNTSPIWPSTFHSIIPLWLAMFYYPLDGGEKDRDWSPAWEGLLQNKKDRMIDWDHKLKTSAMGGRTGYRDDGQDGIPLELM